MDLANKKVIVTGAASGFGLTLVERLVEESCQIAAFDIDQNKLSALKSRYPAVSIYVCDVSDNEQVESNVESVFKDFNGLDILVNNAGIMKNAPLINLFNRNERKHSIQMWHDVISINQNSVFYMSRSVVDRMLENRNKGVIINISSIAACGNIGQTAYSASKAAVEAMTKTWAKELGRFGIRAVAISPGFIDTQATSDALEEKMLQKWTDNTPLKRTGNIEEIIHAIIFAIQNDFYNGEVLKVNGGLVL